jgi:5-methylcytosine-specific restriction enzyme subunit McrC
LLGGVKAARRATTSSSVRRRAADLERRLSDVAPTLPSPRKLLSTKIVYGRRNAHYEMAHTWCRSLLRLARIDDADVPDSPEIDAFLINMNLLFERFVEWLIKHAYEGVDLDVHAQKRNSSLITVNGQYRRSLAPDLVVGQSGRSMAIDAKYKRYGDRELEPADVYQLLLYAQCYTGFTIVPTSYLIYPASRRHTAPTVVELTVPAEDGPRRVRVHAIGIPLAEIVGGLRIGDFKPLESTVQQTQALLPIFTGGIQLDVTAGTGTES